MICSECGMDHAKLNYNPWKPAQSWVDFYLDINEPFGPLIIDYKRWIEHMGISYDWDKALRSGAGSRNG